MNIFGKISSAITQITSWCSVTAKVVAQRLSTLFDDKIATIRTVNPSANVNRLSNTPTRAGTPNAHPSGEGFRDFAEVCEELAGDITTIVSIEATHSIENIRTRLMQYPPANSNYIRTFDLQQGWKTATVSFDTNVSFTADTIGTSISADTSVSLGNNVPYAKWVQRRATQASIHRGRWNTVEDIAEQEMPDLVSRLQETFNQIFQSTD